MAADSPATPQRRLDEKTDIGVVITNGLAGMRWNGKAGNPRQLVPADLPRSSLGCDSGLWHEKPKSTLSDKIHLPCAIDHL